MPKPVNQEFITLRGKLNYAKVLGSPVLNYDKNGNEWKLDFIITDNADLARLKKLGIADKVKQKEEYLDGQPHLTLRQAEFTKAGEKNDSPKVADVTGEPWDQTKLLGNGTVVDLKIRVADYGKGFRKGIYISGIRVLELVPYNRPVFDDLAEDDPYNPRNRVGQDEDQNSSEASDYDDDDFNL